MKIYQNVLFIYYIYYIFTQGFKTSYPRRYFMNSTDYAD